MVKVTSLMMRSRRSISLISKPEHSSSQAAEASRNTQLAQWVVTPAKPTESHHRCVWVCVCEFIDQLLKKVWVLSVFLQVNVWAHQCGTMVTACVFLFKWLWHQKDRAGNAWNSAYRAKVPAMSTHCRINTHTHTQMCMAHTRDFTKTHTFFHIACVWISFPPVAWGWFITQIKISDKGNQRKIK